jgi:hypothetical protein
MSQTNLKQQLIYQLDEIAQSMLSMMQEQYKQTSIVIATLNELRESEPVKGLGDMVSYADIISLTEYGLTVN